MFAILLILTWSLKKRAQQNKIILILKWGVETFAAHLYLGFRKKKSLCTFLFFFRDKKEYLLNVPLTCTFMPWLLDSLDLHRYSSESKKRCTWRLVSRVDFGFDQWPVVSFVIKKLFVYLVWWNNVYTYVYILICYTDVFHGIFTFYDLGINLQIFCISEYLLTLHANRTLKESKITRRFKESRWSDSIWRQTI